ncbi:hypothetical protein GCM10009596_20770 [Arthrobacter rhombi]
MVYPELRKRPEPITPPMAIMIRWRGPMARRSPLSVAGWWTLGRTGASPGGDVGRREAAEVVLAGGMKETPVGLGRTGDVPH